MPAVISFSLVKKTRSDSGPPSRGLVYTGSTPLTRAVGPNPLKQSGTIIKIEWYFVYKILMVSLLSIGSPIRLRLYCSHACGQILRVVRVTCPVADFCANYQPLKLSMQGSTNKDLFTFLYYRIFKMKTILKNYDFTFTSKYLGFF